MDLQDGLAAGGLLLSLVRGLSVAALLAVFGALLFRTLIAARLQPRPDNGFYRDWRLLFWASWTVAIGAALAWLVVQAASMADAHGAPEIAAALPAVLMETRFGQLIGLRMVLLLATAMLLALGHVRLATTFAASATLLQAGHSHAAAMTEGPSLLLVSDVFHLLAAGAWLGGLPPLLLWVMSAPPALAARASRRFSALGTVCVLVLAITAWVQFDALIGTVPGLAGTDYGRTVLAKLALFAGLLTLAALNRFRLTPALAGPGAPRAKRRLAQSITVETGIGLLVVLAAGLLANLPPSMHVQPLWPFPLRPSLDTLNEDPEFRREVLAAALALAGAAALPAAALLIRRLRWPSLLAAAVITWWALPHLRPLLVEAYSTSYFRSPTGFTAASIAEGAQLYPEQCAACHGGAGQGDGPLAKSRSLPPADLTAAHLWMHADGELFWWLTHGIDAPDGSLAMPGFATTLSSDQRWALIDYIRANNEGMALQRDGIWSPPIKAPEFTATCGSLEVSAQALPGRFIRLVFNNPAPSDTGPDIITITASTDPALRPASGCLATDPSVSRAYAIIAGIPETALDGTQFLIDGDGWLRAIHHKTDPGNWDDPPTLTAIVQTLQSQPVATGTAEPMPMRM